MEKIRNQLKALSRQYNYYQKNRSRVRNNLLWLMSQAFPLTIKDIDTTQNRQLNRKWINFVRQFWHVEAIKNMDFNEFNNSYKTWCLNNDVEYNQEQAETIYNDVQSDLAKIPYDEHTQLLIENTIDQLLKLKNTEEFLGNELIRVSQKLPEYETVINMEGVTPLNGAVIMAEIGDINRFEKRTAITAFAGIDPNTLKNSKDNKALKGGKQDLKKALHEVINKILEDEPQDDPVYQFMQKKRSEGKSEPVYKTAGTNKFLRIYYGKVKAFCNKNQEES